MPGKHKCILMIINPDLYKRVWFKVENRRNIIVEYKVKQNSNILMPKKIFLKF